MSRVLAAMHASLVFIVFFKKGNRRDIFSMEALEPFYQ
jgi:hypothetical protein